MINVFPNIQGVEHKISFRPFSTEQDSVLHQTSGSEQLLFLRNLSGSITSGSLARLIKFSLTG